MVIEKGSGWGTPGERPADLITATSDAEAARLVSAHLADRSSRPLTLEAGDLLRTLGGPRSPSQVTHWFTVDLGSVTLDDGPTLPFLSHVLARRRWWRGEGAVVMNAAWYGSLYLGPRAHPNDGLLDITLGSLPARQRLMARRRAHSGTHLPHPGLTTIRVSSWSHRFAGPVPILVDGVPRGRARSIHVELRPDAATIVI